MKLEQPSAFPAAPAPLAPASALHVLHAGATAVAPEPAALVVSPFLHYGPDRAYNPLADQMLELGQPAFEALCRVMAGLEAPPELLRELRERSWVIPAGADLSQRFLLKYVSLEAHTVCNQSCYFCPVSVAPREDYFMPTEIGRASCRERV